MHIVLRFVDTVGATLPYALPILSSNWGSLEKMLVTKTSNWPKEETVVSLKTKTVTLLFFVSCCDVISTGLAAACKFIKGDSVFDGVMFDAHHLYDLVSSWCECW